MTSRDTISSGASPITAVTLYSPLAEREPRGRSNDRHSALSPKARESGSLPQGSIQILDNLDSEGGRIELRRVSPRLTAYKAVSATHGLRLSCGEPAGSRTQFSTLAKESAGRLPPGSNKKPGAVKRPEFLLLFTSFCRETKSLQPVISSVDHAPIFESDFRAEHSPIGRFGFDNFSHDLLLTEN